VADVSAVANPSTGIAVYNSYGSSGSANWYLYGGTSLSSPIVASVYALAANPSANTAAAYPYSHAGSLWDVVSGNNGTCSGSYLCTAGPGYDGPTGLGTPNATGAFGGPDSSVATTSTSAAGSTSTTAAGATTTSTSTVAPTTTTTTGSAPVGTQVVANPGFEQGDFGGWSAGGSPTPVVSGARPHAGSFAAFLGSSAAPTPAGDSWVAQTITVPSTTRRVRLQFWYWADSADGTTDWQEVQIRDTSGAILTSALKVSSHARTWKLVSRDLSPYKGRTIVLWFNVHQDGDAKPTSMYIDDITATVI
jgi:hypothetical protein